MADPTLQPCVLRVLNGPLQGCEFPLTERRTLFIVAPVDLLGSGDSPVSVPPEAIFVPLEHGGCNFEVLLDDGTQEAPSLRLLTEPVQTRRCVFQRAEHIGSLQIVVRAHDQPWIPEHLEPLKDASIHAGVRSWGRGVFFKWLGGSVVVGLLLVLASIGASPQPSPEMDVRALIAGASADVAVVQGRDRQTYVFVRSERDAGWSRQVLMRNGPLSGKVLVIDQERRRLEKVLVDHDPHLAWHSLDLKDPAMPRLLLSAQRNVLTPMMQTKLVEALLEAAPYARDVVVHPQDDSLLADLAEQGLQRLSLAFKRVEHGETVTFALEGDLQDSQLSAVRQYVDGFYRQWGDRYVHFAVELKNDSLNNKSFQNGPQGYVKTTSSSWHFPTQP